jgi:hypothetical protein
MTISVKRDQVALFQVDAGQSVRMLRPPHGNRVDIGRAELSPFDQGPLVWAAWEDGDTSLG